MNREQKSDLEIEVGQCKEWYCRLQEEVWELKNTVEGILREGAQPEPDLDPDPLEQTREVCEAIGESRDTAGLLWTVEGRDGKRKPMGGQNNALYILRMMEWLDDWATEKPRDRDWSIEYDPVTGTCPYLVAIWEGDDETKEAAPTRREALEQAVLTVAKEE